MGRKGQVGSGKNPRDCNRKVHKLEHILQLRYYSSVEIEEHR